MVTLLFAVGARHIIANYGGLETASSISCQQHGCGECIALSPCSLVLVGARQCSTDRRSYPYPNTVCTVASLAPACAHVPVPNLGGGP